MVCPRLIAQYEIIRKLGRSMTDVYLALDTVKNRPVVLKVIEVSPDSLTRLILEAERRGALIQKQLHEFDPRVIEVYGFGDFEGYFFIAMEYVAGQTLAEILERERRMEPQRAAGLALEICSQLDRLHSFRTEIDGQTAAVVHGDIKPSNIQIGPDDQVRLLDFGIAKAITLQHSLTCHDFGSPSYCSPERLAKNQVDQHCDLWAVGVTLYEIVAGSPPYQAENTRKLENLVQSRRPPRALPENCPPALKVIIMKALAGDLSQRYVSAAAFHHDLKMFLQGKETNAERETRICWNSNPTVEAVKPNRSLPAPSRRRPGSVVRVIGTLACLMTGLVIFLATAYARRFWNDSNSIRSHLNYLERSPAEIELDWHLYKTLERQYGFLGRFSPVHALAGPLRSAYLTAADNVIDSYRNSSDPLIQNFDWRKAQTALERAVELDGSDNLARGKLALCRGYADLANVIAWKGPNWKQLVEWRQDGKQRFQEAAGYLPVSPDPHLALARLYVYSFPDVPRALAEFQTAQRLGYQLGPREIEQEADAYLLRARQELNEARRLHGKPSRAQEVRYIRLAGRDFEAALRFYQGIPGFSRVDAHLRQISEAQQTIRSLTARQRRTTRIVRLRNPRRRLWR